jgi:hypothetical protein
VRFERMSILSTMPLDGGFNAFVFSETLNKELFSGYIEKQLKPAWDDENILLLDTLSTHRSKIIV